MLSLLLRLKEQIAVIIVTHRIKTASKADIISILEDGVIVHTNTSQELLKIDNFYSQSFEIN